MPHWRRLTFRQLLTVLFNPWAMLLGPFYFIYLGMWRQALSMSARWLSLPPIGLLSVDGALSLLTSRPAALSSHWLAIRPVAWIAVWLAAALAFAVQANRAFARHVRLPEG